MFRKGIGPCCLCCRCRLLFCVVINLRWLGFDESACSNRSCFTIPLRFSIVSNTGQPINFRWFPLPVPLVMNLDANWAAFVVLGYECDTKTKVEEIWPWVCHVRTRTALEVLNDISGVFGPILWPWSSVHRKFEEIAYIWPFFSNEIWFVFLFCGITGLASILFFLGFSETVCLPRTGRMFEFRYRKWSIRIRAVSSHLKPYYDRFAHLYLSA